MVAKPELIIRLKASVIKGRVARMRTKAVIMEMGNPSESMLIWGAAFEISPVESEVRKSVPKMGRLIMMASRKRRDNPARSIKTM
jgi:hypothetical protein